MIGAIATSYSSASTLPVKILRDWTLLEAIASNPSRILPRHIQICPTNRCDLACSWCSCRDRRHGDTLEPEQLYDLIAALPTLGTVGCTITGGGEPTIYRKFNAGRVETLNDVIARLGSNYIAVGLVTNGLSVHRLEPWTLEQLTWVRISFADTRDWDDTFEGKLDYIRQASIDLAFSYVLTSDPDQAKLRRVADYAKANRFTHVRVVTDILNPDSAAIAKARAWLAGYEGIIFQDRTQYTRGSKRCLISLLKPVIAPDGYIYPCCGVQYALSGDAKTFPERMRMGKCDDLASIIASQAGFDGSVCDRCYYGQYNDLLNALTCRIDHEEFV